MQFTRKQEFNMSENTPKLPEVKFNKNGYEIRTDILAMAKDVVMQDYQVKFAGWQMSAQKDPQSGQIVTTVGMPEFPGMEKILEAAEKFYGFVNTGAKK
jgi:hypothetical protein